jgi:hypothetical protein
VNLRPIRLGDAPMTSLRPSGFIECRFKHCQIASKGDPFSRPITTPSAGVNLV